MSDELKRKSDWEGRYVELKHSITTNGGVVFDAGEVMLVTRNYGGLSLKAIKNCNECSRKYWIGVNKVPESDVLLLPHDYKPKQNDPIANLREELAKAQAAVAEVERLKGIIRKVEWVNLTDGDGNFAYQECSECGYSREHGHHQDCPFRGWEAPDETQA